MKSRTLILLLYTAIFLTFSSAQAQDATLGILHEFDGRNGGGSTLGGLTQGADGTFYGVATFDGANGKGLLFRLTPAGVYTILHQFTGGPDGAFPFVPPVLAKDGNFYGSTNGPTGSDSGGSVFRMTPAGDFTPLYSFTGGADGGGVSGLVQGRDGNFYGTTHGGGSATDTNGFGTVFRITPAGMLATLYTFTNGADGGKPPPTAGLVQGSDGNFYGVTEQANGNITGTVFRITPKGVLTTLHTFNDSGDGSYPENRLLQARDGNFYGTTYFAYKCGGGFCDNGLGTVFRISPLGAYTVLHKFLGSRGNGLNEGATPSGGLIQGTDGNFYGTTVNGGNPPGGTVFRMTPAGNLVTIYSFTNGVDGGGPYSGVIQGRDGNFFGTTSSGTAGSGTVFSLSFGNSAHAAPIIISPLTSGATVGELFTYQIAVLNNPASFTAGALPAGLRFDATFGAITGFPTTAGTQSIHIGAKNSSGSDSAILKLTVDPAQGPVILNGTSVVALSGQPFRFQLYIGGLSSAATLTASGLPSGLTLDPDNSLITGTVQADGSYLATITITDGPAKAFMFLQFTFTSDPNTPLIKAAGFGAYGSGSVGLTPGETISFTTGVPPGFGGGTSYTMSGNLPNGLKFDPVTGTISGTYHQSSAEMNSATKANGLSASSGFVISTVQLFTHNSHGTATAPLTFVKTPEHLLNISTRMSVLKGDNVLIGGFIVTGSDPKKVLIRGIGPSLKGVGVTLSDPTLELHQPDGTIITNDNWKINDQTGQSQEADIRGTTIPPTDNLESAILATLTPGAYTAVLAGKNGGTGVGLVEVYDLAQGANSKLANISTRGFVETGDNVMIGGLIVGGGGGGGMAKVIVRAIGPSLQVRGALGDPTLELRNSSGTLIDSNDNWKTRPNGTSQQAEIEATTIPPENDLESAVVQTLSAGRYTAIVRGKNNTTGIGLVETYNLQ
jgi:uncharacterized repeat protein (TIGR03803 family)